jgi:tryptophan-rich sensory protein
MSEPFFETAWGQIITFAVVALILNFVWFAFRWGSMRNTSYKRNPMIPPGWIIAIVWTVLFGFFGYAHWLVRKANKGKVSLGSVAIIVVAVWCLLYPLFIWMAGTGYSRTVNLFSLLVSFALGVIVFNESELAFYYLLPFIAWGAYICFADSVYCAWHLPEGPELSGSPAILKELLPPTLENMTVSKPKAASKAKAMSPRRPATRTKAKSARARRS